MSGRSNLRLAAAGGEALIAIPRYSARELDPLLVIAAAAAKDPDLASLLAAPQPAGYTRRAATATADTDNNAPVASSQGPGDAGSAAVATAAPLAGAAPVPAVAPPTPRALQLANLQAKMSARFADQAAATAAATATLAPGVKRDTADASAVAQTSAQIDAIHARLGKAAQSFARYVV